MPLNAYMFTRETVSYSKEPQVPLNDRSFVTHRNDSLGVFLFPKGNVTIHDCCARGTLCAALRRVDGDLSDARMVAEFEPMEYRICAVLCLVCLVCA